MNALILGGNGFIGSHLVDHLIQAGHRVRVFDRYEEHFRAPLPGVDYRFGDFGNRGLLTEALQGIDTVFHLISTTLPKTSNDDPAFDVQSNVVESIFLLEKCVEYQVGKVVFVSSGGTVYGVPQTVPVPEHHAMDPICSYGIAKITIEKYLALFKHLYGLDYAVLRLANPYGERQNPVGIQGAIPVFLGKVAKNEVIEIWGDGTIIRDYAYIGDIVAGIYRAALVSSCAPIFNLGSGVGYSLNQILDMIRKVVGSQIKVRYCDQRAFDVPEIYLDVGKAARELAWQPVTTLEEGITRTWRFVSGLYRQA